MHRIPIGEVVEVHLPPTSNDARPTRSAIVSRWTQTAPARRRPSLAATSTPYRATCRQERHWTSLRAPQIGKCTYGDSRDDGRPTP